MVLTTEDGQGSIDEAEGIVRVVEEEDVGESQYQAWHGQRNHRHKVDQRPAEFEPAALSTK